MHEQDLLSVEHISKITGIDWWVINDLFKEYGVEKLGFSELSRRRRERDFELIYNLHYKNKLSLNEIHREYGFSPLYTKRVLGDQGLTHLGYENQLKREGRRIPKTKSKLKHKKE
ncbi:AraC family transcriptional regulator [Priestia endophytica]